MIHQGNIMDIRKQKTEQIYHSIAPYDIDLIGIASLAAFKHDLDSNLTFTNDILYHYNYAIVIGAQYGKLGKKISGMETSLYLEKVALDLMCHIVEKEKSNALIIHTEDEIDAINRKGIMSLKALAKAAGLGWQGRSLLIVSPEYGPIHRLIAVLTDTPLNECKPIANQCNDCYLCIEKCPVNALKNTKFEDHPSKREDILDISTCKGDNGCNICILVCPWIKKDLKANKK